MHNISDQDNRAIGWALAAMLFVLTVMLPVGLTGISWFAWVILAVTVGLIGRAVWHGAQRFVHWYMTKERERP